MERATLVDVTQIAGVSRANVWYVHTGRTNGRITISPETIQRVFEAVAEFGHIPDAQAQAPHSSSTGIIGVIIPDIHNPHFWQQQYVNGIDRVAQDTGYPLFVSSASLDPKLEEGNRISPY